MSESAGVPGETGLPEPSVPLATKIPGAAIVHVYGPFAPAGELHVQETSELVPPPAATALPCLSATFTVQGSAAERRARNVTGPPSTPTTAGA